MNSETDRIEKSILLRAPQKRVWQAISNAKEFGHWFGVEFDGPFVAGAHITGRIVPTKVDAEVAKMQEPYSGMACDVTVERIEPVNLLSFRWHPYAIEAGADSTKEPTTLVTFELEAVSHGTMLTITESGFDRIPLARRAEAFKSNEEGWSMQAALIEKYLTQKT
ncbi:MAG: SRPBCC family protein [Woeseia sp.]